MSGLRSRSRNGWTPTAISISSPGQPPIYYAAGQHGEESSITEMVTDNWRDAIKSGQIIMGSLVRSISRRSYGHGTFHLYVPSKGYNTLYGGDISAYVWNSGTAPSFMEPDAGELTRVRDLAVASARSKAHESSTLVGETYSDLGETVRMLRHPFKGVLKLLEKIGRAKMRHAKSAQSVTQANANAWLEYRYGWKPLMMEIETIISAASKIREAKESRRLVFRATESSKGEDSWPFSNVALPGILDRLRANGCYTRSIDYRASAGVIVEVKSLTTLEALEKIFGFRCRDLPSTLWALTPFSFVADWFVNVDDWLQAVIPDPSVRTVGSWVTTVSNTKILLEDGYLNDPTEPSLLGAFSRSTRENVVIERIPNPDAATLPTLLMKPLSVTHSVDAMSLLSKPIISSINRFSH